MREDNTNYNVPWPHLYLKSEGGIHKNIWMLQNEPELQENLATQNAFAHDASSGDVG